MNPILKEVQGKLSGEGMDLLLDKEYIWFNSSNNRHNLVLFIYRNNVIEDESIHTVLKGILNDSEYFGVDEIENHVSQVMLGNNVKGLGFLFNIIDEAISFECIARSEGEFKADMDELREHRNTVKSLIKNMTKGKDGQFQWLTIQSRDVEVIK